MANDKFWFFIEKELYEITIMLKDSLNLPQFYRDYENEWEWCESEEKNEGIYFDITREHNWEHGIYNCPVILVIKKDGKVISSQDEIENIAINIVNCLKVDVFYGIVTFLEDSKYSYDVKRKFNLDNIAGR